MTAPNDVVLDIQQLGTAMIEAARKAIAGRAVQKAVVETELRRLAGALADTSALLVRGEIDRQRAERMVRIYRLTVSSVLRSVEGLTLLAADDALAAAMRVAGNSINRITRFKLIPDKEKP